MQSTLASKPISAVIFDCDGVLVDSEVITVGMWVEVARELGVELSFDQAMRRFKGGVMAKSVRWLEETSGRKLREDFVEDFRAQLKVRFEEKLKPVAGDESVLTDLPVPYCVASNGPRVKMDVTLSVTGLKQFFKSRIVSAYEVGLFKPDPGLFLAAAELLELTPPECAVVVDSITGIKAGVAAGMQVYAYSTPYEFDEHCDAGAVPFGAMHELPALLFPESSDFQNS